MFYNIFSSGASFATNVDNNFNKNTRTFLWMSDFLANNNAGGSNNSAYLLCHTMFHRESMDRHHAQSILYVVPWTSQIPLVGRIWCKLSTDRPEYEIAEILVSVHPWDLRILKIRSIFGKHTPKSFYSYCRVLNDRTESRRNMALCNSLFLVLDVCKCVVWF